MQQTHFGNKFNFGFLCIKEIIISISLDNDDDSWEMLRKFWWKEVEDL